MDIFNNGLVIIFSAVIDLLIAYLLLCIFFKRKTIDNRLAFGLLILGFVFLILIDANWHDIYITTTACLLFGLTLSFGLFNGTIISKFFIVLSFNVFSLLSQLLILNILSTVDVFHNSVILLSKSCLLIVLYAIFKISRRDTVLAQFQFPKRLFIFPIFAILTFCYDFIYGSASKNDGVIINSLSAMVVVIAGIMILTEKSKTEKIKYSLNVLTNQMENQTSLVGNLEMFQTGFKKIWHDFNNHIICINQMIKDADYSALKEYTTKICDVQTNLNKPVSTGNIIFDSMINAKKQLAFKNNIEFVCNVKLPFVIYIDQVDLCIILGNLFDNALEACLNIEVTTIRKIEFQVGYKNDFLYISIKNSTEGDLKPKHVDAHLHGIGMQNIEDAVLRNNGNIVVEHVEHQFIVKIMLKNSNSGIGNS